MEDKKDWQIKLGTIEIKNNRKRLENLLMTKKPELYSGIGIFFVMYSHTTSMLYFSCVDIGTTRAPLAMVP